MRIKKFIIFAHNYVHYEKEKNFPTDVADF